MEVKIAEKAGFCPGAKYSFELATQIAKTKKKAFGLGPLLHNEEVLDYLRKRGIECLDLDEIEKRASEVEIVVIRAHGVPIKDVKKLEKLGFSFEDETIQDGTCWHVKSIYDIVKRYQDIPTENGENGYTIFIFGEEGHPEVDGIASRVKNPVIIEKVEDIPDKRYGKVCLVSQTTQRTKKYDKVIDVLSERCKKLEAENTICNATNERQEAAAKLAREVDVMLVIGGKESNNSKKLYDICTEANSRSHFIQTYENLQNEWFDSAENIGITAGASTPDFVIDAVVYALDNANF